MIFRGYIVNVEYITPSGKRSTYTESVFADTPFQASQWAKEWLKSEPRRRVAKIVSASVTR